MCWIEKIGKIHIYELQNFVLIYCWSCSWSSQSTLKSIFSFVFTFLTIEHHFIQALLWKAKFPTLLDIFYFERLCQSLYSTPNQQSLCGFSFISTSLLLENLVISSNALMSPEILYFLIHFHITLKSHNF